MYYLYVKRHKQTGLKYLGYTTKSDYHSYSGSGQYWTRHLKVHGFDYHTTLMLETESKDELVSVGKLFSELFNIVDSPLWANLKPEEGSGGSHYVSDDQKRRQSKKMKGRFTGPNNSMFGKIRNDTIIRNQLPKQWITNGVEDRLILKEVDRPAGFWVGRSRSNTQGKKMKLQTTTACLLCNREIRPTNYERHYKSCNVYQI